MLASKLKPVVLGFVGVAFAFVAWHLWIDHQALHVLFSIESVRQKQFQEQGK